MRLCRAVVGALPAEGGALALVLSTSVRAPIAGLAASNGLRPGLGMLAKTMADELGPRGVRVNGLLPGRIATDRLRELGGSAAAGRRGVPLGRDGRAGGVRAGGGVPAQPGGVVRHRGDGAGRRRGGARAVDRGTSAP